VSKFLTPLWRWLLVVGVMAYSSHGPAATCADLGVELSSQDNDSFSQARQAINANDGETARKLLEPYVDGIKLMSLACADLYFPLLQLEVESSHFEEAFLILKSWPSGSAGFSPIVFATPNERPACEISQAQVLAHFIPADPNYCLAENITKNCIPAMLGFSDGFATRYLGSSLLAQAQELDEQFYLYNFNHLFSILQNQARQYEHAVRPIGTTDRLLHFLRNWANDADDADGNILLDWSLAPDGTPGFSKLPQYLPLSQIILMSFDLLKICKSSEQKQVRQFVLPYLIELRDLLRKDPRIKEQLIPPLQNADLDQLIQNQ